MASITVRKIPDRSKERLRVQAAQSGLSLEEHVRRILQEASNSPREKPVNIVELADQYFGSKQGVHLELPPRGSHRRLVDFDS